MSDTLEYILRDSTNLGDIKPLPPVHEVAWLPHQKEVLHMVATQLLGYKNSKILTLFQKCKAVSLGEFIIGSKISQYTTSSHVLAKHPQHPHNQHLARIEFFAKVDVITTADHQSSFWIAVVSFYYEHQCKVWFGHPTQVWARSTLPDWFFIPISYIQSRVAYCEVEVDFGHVISREKIMVVSPLAIY